MKMKNAVLSNFYKKKPTSLMALSTLSKLRAKQFVLNAQRTAEKIQPHICKFVVVSCRDINDAKHLNCRLLQFSRLRTQINALSRQIFNIFFNIPKMSFHIILVIQGHWNYTSILFLYSFGCDGMIYISTFGCLQLGILPSNVFLSWIFYWISTSLKSPAGFLYGFACLHLWRYNNLLSGINSSPVY